ncbi:MAG: hypothetical protein RLZZ360_356 [Candidatus Parcubacteria bacterium]|jgi:ABC-type transporter MlaC component
MRLILAVLLLALIAPTRVQALTTEEARVCANELLSAYNERRFPEKFLAIESITRRAFGQDFRTLTDAERALAIKAATNVLKASFESPSGEYRYRDLTVNTVEVTKEGNFRIIGTAHITSPQFTGMGEFKALTNGKCQIYQVRIEEVATLDGELRKKLMTDPVARPLIEKSDN